MQIIKSGFFICCTLLYFFALTLKFSTIQIHTWFHSYLADLLAMPIISCIALLLLRLLKKNKTLVLSKTQIVLTFLYLSVFFEFLLPKTSTRYTQDYWDVFYYALGAIAFYVYQEKSLKKYPSV